ncbi:hypothetical protein F4780DRAFT_774194 [Xylariomycetidae sp. FL0641]|nr:hypothetical protein F4780DRAFT_774194 [Xylariomycetidae sp. FL0641]
MQSKPHTGIPKSRTFGVFSNITSSFSRTSLGSFAGGESRHTSTSSGDPAAGRETPYLNESSAASSSSTALINPPSTFNNPRQVHTAQPSEYWTGRFMALQDRFHAEMLMPDNLNTLVNAHAERSMVPEFQRATNSLAASATTSCIPTKATSRGTQPRLSSSSPRKTQQSQKSSPSKRKAPQHPTSSIALASKTTTSMEAATLLTDEDNRSHRIFLHLEAMCTTSEARRSLHAWQQSYARRMGKENLLPRGGSMDTKERDKGWVGRLLSGSNSLGKRGSLAV